LTGLAVLAVSLLPARAETRADKKVPAVLNFKMKSLAGTEVNLARYKGKVVLIVNVASECGFTPQYEGLQALHKKYAKKGLAVLGIPSNDFRMQEPGTNEEIAKFCKDNYGVTFDMFAKVVVKGEGQCPLYKFLTSKKTNPKFSGEIGWNFAKFLISRDGKIVGRFASKVKPDDKELVDAIKKELAKK
jgi:glutathione peroxidase